MSDHDRERLTEEAALIVAGVGHRNCWHVGDWDIAEAFIQSGWRPVAQVREIEAMRIIDDEMQSLDSEQQARVIRWAMDRFTTPRGLTTGG